MTPRETIDEAVIAAANAHRQNSGKWNQLYAAFDSELGLDRGVVGKLLTQEKQLANRLQKELARENPLYVVLCVLEPDVRMDPVRDHLARANLPAAKAALIFGYTEANGLYPIELQIYDDDAETQRIAATYSELEPRRVDRPESRPATTSGTNPDTSVRRATPAMVPVEVGERIRRALRLALQTTSAILLVGPPGTGKTALLHELLEEAESNPEHFGFLHAHTDPIWKTPEESWGTRELLGGETVAENDELRFREGLILRAIRDDRWVVLDEANRADMDKIFGGMLTWLSGQDVNLGTVTSDPDSPPILLGWGEETESDTENLEALTAPRGTLGAEPVRYLAGREWRLLGTYNAVDAQRVFRLGHALGRRFMRVPIPPATPGRFETIATGSLLNLPPSVRARIPALYTAHYEASEDTQLGPALFLRIPKYVEAGLEQHAEGRDVPVADEDRHEVVSALDDEVAEAQDGPDFIGIQLVAEAYLVNIGAFLARYEPEDLSELGRRIVENGALPDSEWRWVLEMARHLG